MEKTTKMVEEITEKRKMTQEVKNEINKRIFFNCLVAIGIMLYICVIDVVYIYSETKIINIALKIFSMIFIFLTVGVFEFAYRKDSGRIAIVGIELLVFSVIVLYIPQIYTNIDKAFCQVLTFTPIFCAIYYITKSILIYIKSEKKYQNNLSDVKEIMKDEEN